MSVQWKIVIMSFFLFSTAHAGGYCGPNKIYACVPTLFCKDGRSTQRNPAAHFNRQCFSFESCCDVNRVIYGMRYTGGDFEPGPYEQISEPFNNASGKTSGTNSQQSTGNTGGTSPTLKKKGGVSSITNIQNTNNGGGKNFTTNSQMPSYTMKSQPSNNAGGKTTTANNQAPSDSDGKTFTHSTNLHAHSYLNNNSGKTNLGNPSTANTKNTKSPNYHHYQNHNYNPSGNLGRDVGVHRLSSNI
uniref:Uncharacterized protein, isoform A n=2 Tax=Drosophila melanogaster TaxID=7227 RepID=M9MRU8_DROME|nr:uncharacterized protein Dmel_CG42876, isoform A [Drosophila melanogaster]NP_001285965.1 uncharacterized protein Dmel_CG42876, isoform B [Drosophila melanogaster]ADV37067.1 uncharacterized protein Dmel_CG42876, isoform A [Drosophila melanogaster]AHN54479.1 uncharacterized protein Dmel_CG42876, isoform B [Drosophila melanogaster]AOQ14127.1 CG42876-PA [synthetic construct]|eukprot:NP_001188818.1 uncharacterized protein Dmel_CG42876, isoform A [Drosophila melanogaster]